MWQAFFASILTNTVYHGSTKVIEKPVFGLGNQNNDYGLGFYCTETIDLAKEWACSAEADGYANQYTLDISDLSILSLTGGDYHILNWLFVLLENRKFKFGKGNPKYVAGMSGFELAEAVLNTTNIKYKKIEPTHIEFKGREYWGGWILAYYQWFTGKRFEDIVKGGLPLSTVFSMYILHEADESKFVEHANEILNQNKQTQKSKLHQIRKARGFTQQQLAEASGVTLRMIQLYEQGQNDINI